jgi:hypothetical protein
MKLLIYLAISIGLLIGSLYIKTSFVRAQTSTNYELENYGFGGGGVIDSASTNYSLEAILGEIAGKSSSTNYKANSGLIFAQNAAVPPVPTFVNSSNWYNKLKITINQTSGDPSTTEYAIAISTDNFVADTRYVQSDNTIGSVLGTEDFQTYTAWGGASGEFIIGLSSNTTYYVKVKSTRGKYTESAFGPVASAATVGLQVSFDIDIGGGSDPGETASPYTIGFGNLNIGSVSTASNRAWIDFATNAEAGGWVFVYDQNAGLKSTVLNYTIGSATADLASGAVSEGFGLQGASKTQTSGGPLDYTSPYNGSLDNVGVVNTVIREIFNSTSGPIVGGRGSISVKAKASSITPGSSDYADTITLIATGSF